MSIYIIYSLQNDFLLDKLGDWDMVISKSYNFRVSLTHYYQTMYDEVVESYIDNNFDEFEEKINDLIGMDFS